MKPDRSPPAFHGDLRRIDRVGGFTLAETVYARGAVIPRHTHERPYFCFVLWGGYTESYGSRSREYAPPALVFHPEGEVHSDRFHASGGRLLNVTVPGHRTAVAPGTRSPFDDGLVVEGGPAAGLAAKLYREFQHPDAVSPLVIEGLILEILGMAARTLTAPERSVPPWLLRAADLLRARFRENLSLAELARPAGVHPVYLARAFRTHLNSSAGEFVRQLRVEHARGHLCRGDLTLAQIAADAGFADQSHFTIVFKRHTGLTPAAYRRLFRGR